LADPDRLQIVACLFEGEKHVTQIAENLGKEIANVSHHLGVLRAADLVTTSREGRFIVYTLHPEVRGARQARHSEINLGCCRLEFPRPR
jgi:ArsR family transcriptional regulator